MSCGFYSPFVSLISLLLLPGFGRAAWDYQIRQPQNAAPLVNAASEITTNTDCHTAGEWVFCSGTELPSSVAENKRIEWLISNKSHLQPEDFNYKFRNLVALKLSGSEILSIANDTFICMSSLVTLTITSTKIFSLCAGVFHGLDSLRHLDLSNNSFGDLKDVIPALSELSNIHNVILTTNKISTLNTPQVVELMTRLSLVDLTDNPIECSCKLKPLRPYILDYKNFTRHERLFVKTGMCDGPTDQQNNTVASYLVRIYKKDCLTINKSMISIYFLSAVFSCAGLLYVIEPLVKKLQNYKKKKPNIGRLAAVNSDGMQVTTPLLTQHPVTCTE